MSIVRISLVERERQTQRRRKAKGRRPEPRTYGAAIPQSWEQPTWRTGKSRTTSRRLQADPQAAAPGWLRRALGRSATRILHWFSPARWLLALAFVALLGLLGFASVDRMFFVYEAQITGTHHTQPSLVYETAGIHEQNIFWIKPRDVARNIVGLPGVKSVRVRCTLPANVTIELVEREPIVLWRSIAQGRDFWLDEEGLVLPHHGDPSAASTVFVVDYSDRQLEEGAHLEPAGLVDSVLQLTAEMPQARLFFYSADRGLSYHQQEDGGQWTVYVGTSDSLPRKIQAVGVISEYLRTNGIRASYIDVRWPDRPVYGLSGSQG